MVIAPLPVSQIPPTEAGEERDGCAVYEAAENRPISALPGTVPLQLEAVFQSVLVAALLQLSVADHALESPGKIVQASASPAAVQQARRMTRIGIARWPKNRAGDCPLLRGPAGTETSGTKVIVMGHLSPVLHLAEPPSKNPITGTFRVPPRILA
jgi:hypothetical protein